MSKAKKEPVLCTFCNHEKRFHVDGKGACVSMGVVCVLHCRKFQAPVAAKVKYPYVIYLQHKEEVGRVVAEDVYAESKHAWQCAKRNSVVASYYPKEQWDAITKEQFELLLMTAAERAKVEAKTPLPLPRKILEISEDSYRVMLEDVPEDDPCECGLEGCKRCRPEEDDEIFYPNTYRVALDITTRQAVSLQDVARLLDTKKIASPFVGAEVVSIARRE